MSVKRPRQLPPDAGSLLQRLFREPFGFVWGALTNVITTSIAFGVSQHAQLAHLMIIHLLGAVLISTRYGMAVSTFTATTGALAFDYFCIPPVFAFALPDPHSVLTFAGMLLVALFVCWLNQGVREQREAAHASEARTSALCALSLDLSRVTEPTELASRTDPHLERLFGPGSRLVLGPPSGSPARFERLRIGTDEIVGHLIVPRSASGGPHADDRRLLLVACADRVTGALLRLALDTTARRAQLAAELERNRNALLSSVSHDLKTPLGSILVASTALLRQENGNRRLELLETIIQEAERMNRMIANLLSVTRLEGGEVELNHELECIDELILAALSRLSGRMAGRQVTLDLPEDLPLLRLDAVLMDQLLSNLLENVLRYTPGGSPVTLAARQQGEMVIVEVADRGPGIAAPDRERVFDKFFRGPGADINDGGTGLGLTICRAVARAHAGDMIILPRSGGGSIVRLSLPCVSLPTLGRLSTSRSVQA